jgi:hypothetical protein
VPSSLVQIMFLAAKNMLYRARWNFAFLINDEGSKTLMNNFLKH